MNLYKISTGDLFEGMYYVLAENVESAVFKYRAFDRARVNKKFREENPDGPGQTAMEPYGEIHCVQYVCGPGAYLP